MGRIFWIDLAAIYVLERSEPGDAEAFAEGRDQVRSWHGLDFALVPLHAWAVYPRTEEFCRSGMERSGSAGGGDENQFGDSGHGRSAGDFAPGETGGRPGCGRQTRREFGRLGQGGPGHSGRV